MSPAKKKPGLDLMMNNYRPVSNLCFVSKLVERCMLRQLIGHCNTNSLIPDFQLAYRENYSMENSFIKMGNNILWPMEKHQITMKVILNLLAAFHTVDHDILLNILQNNYGITDKAQQWFSNYLWPWHFKVSTGNKYIKPQLLHFVVPPESCSEANIFTCHSALIDKVVPEDIVINGFADYHSLRKSFPAYDTKEEKCPKEMLEATIAPIKSWMDQMRLKLNADKTEYITFGSRDQLKICKLLLTICNDTIQMTSDVKYLGRILDTTFNFNKHITMKIKKAMTNFICIRAIGKYLSRHACTTLVLMVCILHLDYGSVLLYGLPKKSINRLQTIQNMCAMLVLKLSKYLSTTQALKDLHWLPIEEQIQFQILMIRYKAIYNTAPKYIMDPIGKSKPKRNNM